MVVMKNTEEQTIEQQQVKDTYKIAYILHFFLGAGNLLPWNAFITAIDYFARLYPTKNVERVFSVAYMSSSLLILLVLVVRHVSLSRAGVQARASSLRLRMNIGFSMFILAMMVAPTIDWTHCRSTMPYKSFLLTGVSVVVCGLADGLIGGSLIGFAGQLPKEYMQAVFAGTASSGVLVSILRVITKASLPENQQGLKTSTHFYFIVSAIILLICMICSNLLFTLPLIQNHYNQLNNQTNFPSTIKPKFRNTARKILGPTFGILSIYVVTLSIFPGFISDDNRKSRVLGDWYPILLIVVYNFSDLAGKSLTAVFIPSNKNIGKVIWACFGRVVFYPAFRVCLHGPRWLETDASIVFLTFMLGLTNGYLTSALMILAPKSVTVVEAETVAVVMAVALGLGLVGGSVLGWLWVI
ncbi:equilibrative nucleotide transporter 8 [Silene latifolia]|uniref:equilibrative nucleotide transporter 8 n=1 Tax=Silene latifolia TaxID=37657 RepID=UPI003D786FB8